MFVKEDLGDRKVLRENLTRRKSNNFNPTSYYVNRSARVYFNIKRGIVPHGHFTFGPFPLTVTFCHGHISKVPTGSWTWPFTVAQCVLICSSLVS